MRYSLIKTIGLFIVLSGVILSFTAAQAQGQDGYIIVHALNEEDIEIGTITHAGGFWPEVYDGDNRLGYTARDAESFGKAIVISPGIHTIKVVFNGMTLEKEIDIAEGQTQTLVFRFPRATYDFTSLLSAVNCNLSASIAGSFSEGDYEGSGSDWHAKDSQRVEADWGPDAPYAYLRFSAYWNGPKPITVTYSYDLSAGLTIKAAGGEFSQESYGSYQYTEPDPGTHKKRYVVGISTDEWGHTDNRTFSCSLTARQDFDWWFTQSYVEGDYPRCHPLFRGLVMGPNDPFYTGMGYIDAKNPPASYTVSWENYYVHAEETSSYMHVKGRLYDIKMSSVPYDITGAGIKYEGQEETKLVIEHARTNMDIYALNSDVVVDCMVYDEDDMEILDAEVRAEITMPDGTLKLSEFAYTPVSEVFGTGTVPNYRVILKPMKQWVDDISESERMKLRGVYNAVISARKEGYKPARSDVLNFEMVISRVGGRVSFLQRDEEDGRLIHIPPAEGVVVEIKGGHDHLYAITDARGVYKKTIENPGEYTIAPDSFTVEGEKIAHDPRTVDVPLGKSVFVDFPNNYSKIELRIRDDELYDHYVWLREGWMSTCWEYFGWETGLSLLTAPFTAANLAAAEFNLFAFELFSHTAQDVLMPVLKDILRDSADKAINSNIKWMADPPDPDYTEIFLPQVPDPVSLPPDYDGAVTENLINMANALAVEAAIEEALMVTYERYLAALEADEPGYMIMQLEEFIRYCDLLTEKSGILVEPVTLVKEDCIIIQSQLEQGLLDFQERLRQDGFKPEEEDGLRGLGFSGSDLEEYMEFLLELDFATLFRGLDDLKSFAERRHELSSAAKTWAAETLSFLTASPPSLPVEVGVKIVPRVINVAGRGKFIAFITPPEDNDPSETTIESIYCENASAVRWRYLKRSGKYMAWFRKRDLTEVSKGHVNLRITGEVLHKGELYNFEGTDIVRIIKRPWRGKKRRR